MVTAGRETINWHFAILPGATKRALDFLSKQEWLKRTPWYLAGGTALALQMGHRRSVDLDFFLPRKRFDNKEFLRHFTGVKAWNSTVNKESTIYGELFRAKVSFIAYPFFVPAQPYAWYGNVRTLSPTDIAVMKVIAISQRGTKRDFFDLYWCSQHVESLEDVIRRLPTQYPSVAHDYHHILKALVYFDDAETNPEPTIYFNATWRKVKQFFIREVPAIAGRLIR